MKAWLAAAKNAQNCIPQHTSATLVEKTLLSTGVDIGNFCIYSTKGDALGLMLRPLVSAMGQAVYDIDDDGADADDIVLLEGNDVDDVNLNVIIVAILGRGSAVAQYTFMPVHNKSAVIVHGLSTEPKRFSSLTKAFKWFRNPKVFPRPVAPLHHLMDWNTIEDTKSAGTETETQPTATGEWAFSTDA